MTKSEHVEGLYNSMVIELSIGCCMCMGGLIETREDDGTEWAKALYKKGWRVKNDKATCPKCVKSK